MRCEWHTFQSHEEMLASSCYNSVLLWNAAMSDPTCLQMTMDAHKRVITDLEWSLFDPNILCSSSIDTYIHLWDIRYPTHPARSFCSHGKSVRKSMWNRKSEFLFASVHDKDVSVWDVRYGSRPVKVLSSDTGKKIRSIDWSHVAANNLLFYEEMSKIKV